MNTSELFFFNYSYWINITSHSFTNQQYDFMWISLLTLYFCGVSFNLVLKIIYTRDITELRILVTRVNFVLFMSLTKCIKMVSTTVKIFNINRMKDFKNIFKPVACVLYFYWNNQNLALPIEGLETRASTVVLCFYFLAYSPCSSLADSFITTTFDSPPPTSTTGIAYILTICLSLCATCLHPLEFYSSLHHNHLSATLRHLSPPAGTLQ